MENGPRKECVRRPKFVLTEKLLQWVRPLAGPGPQPSGPVGALEKPFASCRQGWSSHGRAYCFLTSWCHSSRPCSGALAGGTQGTQRLGHPLLPAVRQPLGSGCLCCLTMGGLVRQERKFQMGWEKRGWPLAVSGRMREWEVGLWGSSGLLSQSQAEWPRVHCLTPLASSVELKKTEYSL